MNELEKEKTSMNKVEILNKVADALLEIIDNEKTAASPQGLMVVVEAAKILVVIAQLKPTN